MVKLPDFILEFEPLERFRIEVRPRCYFLKLVNNYLYIRTGSVFYLTPLFLFITFVKYRAVFLLVRNTAIDRPWELTDGVQYSYRLGVADLDAFFVQRFECLPLLAVSCAGIVNGISIFIFSHVYVQELFFLLDHFHGPRIAFVHSRAFYITFSKWSTLLYSHGW